jgi:TolB-like protein
MAQSAGRDRRPTIAIMPFENLSGDQAQQYFSDGLAEDLIDRISKYRVFSVIGRQSALHFPDQRLTLEGLVSRLNPDYLVTGNVRRSENGIRIAARLIDARSELALWAEQYDRPLQDLIALQDEVADVIAGTLATRLGMEVGRRVVTGSQVDVSSFEHVLQGIWHFSKLSLTDNEEAAVCFRRAIEAYPENAEAHRWLSAYHVSRWFIMLSKADLVQSYETAAQAVALDPASARCHTAHALPQMWMEDKGLDAAAISYKQAMVLNPGDPDVLIELGLFKTYKGDLGIAQDFFDRAYRLNPMPPLWFAEFRGVWLFVEERYGEAWRGFAAVPESAWDTIYLLACLGHLHDRERAMACRRRIAAASWKSDLLAAAASEPFLDPEPRHRLVEGVAKALAF